MNTPFHGRTISLAFLFCCCLLAPWAAQASIVVTGTRVIYPAESREITVKLNNEGSEPTLIQSWIDSGDAKATPDTASAPFILTPPIARVDSHKGQTLRIRYTNDKALPQDKESVFWLNILEVPPSVDDGKNKLKIAFRTRLKLFYRPAKLAGEPATAASKLEWRVERSGKNWVLDCSNPSPYYVSLNSVSVGSESVNLDINNGIISPGQHQRLTLKTNATPARLIKYTTINDYGAVVPFEKPVIN